MRRSLVVLVVVCLVAAVLPFVGDALFDWLPDARVLPPHGESVAIGTPRHLNVYDEGAGDVIVLVHGWGSNASDWGPLPGRLRARGHRVIAYDRAGYGYSTRLAPRGGEYTYASNAVDLRALLDALGIVRATIVGWSFGGGVVQHFAVAHPDRTTAVALIASVADAGRRRALKTGLFDTVLASPTIAPLALAWLARIPPLAWETTHRRVVASFSREEDVPTGWTIRTQAMLSLPGTFTAMSAELAQADARTLRPEQITAPTLVIHGRDDVVIPYAAGEALAARIDGATLIGIEHGSHMLPVTHPDVLADALDDLVRTSLVDRDGAPP